MKCVWFINKILVIIGGEQKWSGCGRIILCISRPYLFTQIFYFVALSTTRHSCGLYHCVHWRFFFFFWLSLFSKSRPIRIRWYICPFAQRIYSHDDGSFADTFFALGLLAWLLTSRDLSLSLSTPSPCRPSWVTRRCVNFAYIRIVVYIIHTF